MEAKSIREIKSIFSQILAMENASFAVFFAGKHLTPLSAAGANPNENY